MLFTDKNGQRLFTLHYPNDRYKEHPCFIKAELDDNSGVKLIL